MSAEVSCFSFALALEIYHLCWIVVREREINWMLILGGIRKQLRSKVRYIWDISRCIYALEWDWWRKMKTPTYQQLLLRGNLSSWLGKWTLSTVLLNDIFIDIFFILILTLRTNSSNISSYLQWWAVLKLNMFAVCWLFKKFLCNFTYFNLMAENKLKDNGGLF